MPELTEREARVLIVDDEPEVAQMFATQLEARFETAVATSGREALGRIDEGFDVVLLDRRIPDLSGDEVLRELRDQGFDAYVVMVTAVDPDLSILELDFDDYLTKPVDEETLTDAVERMLERRQHDRQLRRLLRISSKLSTLESKMELEQLQDSEEYQSLSRDFEKLWDRVIERPPPGDEYQASQLEKIESMLSTMSR